MPDAREVRLTPAARRDMQAIWQYTVQQWGAAQAERYTGDLAAAMDQLAADPMRAKACDHIRPGYRRQGSGSHMIYFRVTDYGIAVVRVLHQRMAAERRL